ncbi:ribosome silencing factor [Janthinobacterium psychrotolerans]|uniref:Ribosomal silencing factor RsfS n=1 Tax=Janthinobacterium psychrotolerans TaxID=1747903 RepID=A0A1A7BVZ0_9BURK|nr:ribosome silencing factor [Janthinobacterium psychrotolerans]OBV37672.1 ribosome-associated protein [Janthinobacterium psychrotolerans]
MDIKKLQTLVVDALEDVKGQDIAVFDTVHLTSLFDRIAIVSGTSNRQTKALAASVRDKVKEAGGEIVGMEGEDTGEWVLVDLGDMIVHIMQAPIRAYYRLEEIWGDKPVKLGAAKRAPKKATGDEPKKVSGHLAASKANVEATPVIEKKAPAKKAAATTAKKAPAKKAVASKAVGKTVKVAPTKTEAAAVKALKALPEKKVRAPRAAKPAADAAPAKTVIKRIKKVDE